MFLLIVGLTAGCYGCNDVETDDGTSGHAAQEEPADVAQPIGWIPWSVCYQRLGATKEGGVWEGRTEDCRVILYLGDAAGTDNTYLAVIRGAKEPKTSFFDVRQLEVDRKGRFEFCVEGIEGDSYECTIGVYGSCAGGRIRFDHTVADRAAAIPPKITLERSSANDETARLLARYKKTLSEY